MPAEIPGYYFDATKKKYFRIQPNHIAPVGSQYSRQAVNAANAIEREERQDRGLQASKRQAQVIRSDLLRHPLLTFDRRLGYQTVSPTDIAANYFSSAVVGRDAIHFPRGLFGRLEDYFDTFDVEPETGNLCAAARLREGSAVRVFYSGHGNGGAVYRRDHSSVIPACPGKISCVLAFAPALVVWSADRLVSSTSIMFIGDATHAHTPAYHVTTSFTISAKIWDMAASPNRSCWALATSDGVQIRQGGGTAIGNQVLHSRVSEEQMTVQFKDENTFMAGARSGKVTFGDVRGGLVLRLRHPSGVSGLRVLRDSNYILVNGLQHMRIYDLRYAPTPTSAKSSPKQPHSRWHESTTPATLDFTIPPTRTQKQYGLGFDYDPELNIIASSSTDFIQQHLVNLWSASTGKPLPPRYTGSSSSRLAKHKFPGPVTCLKFARLRDGPKSLLLASNGLIQEWTPQGTGHSMGTSTRSGYIVDEYQE